MGVIMSPKEIELSVKTHGQSTRRKWVLGRRKVTDEDKAKTVQH